MCSPRQLVLILHQVLKPWWMTPAEPSQWFPFTSMWLRYSRAHCLISAPHNLLLSTVHIWIVSTTTDAPLSAPSAVCPLPLCLFDQILSIFLSLTPAQSLLLTVSGMIVSCEISRNCIIISQPCTFDSLACNKYWRCTFISLLIYFNLFSNLQWKIVAYL